MEATSLNRARDCKVHDSIKQQQALQELRRYPWLFSSLHIHVPGHAAADKWTWEEVEAVLQQCVQKAMSRVQPSFQPLCLKAFSSNQLPPPAVLELLKSVGVQHVEIDVAALLPAALGQTVTQPLVPALATLQDLHVLKLLAQQHRHQWEQSTLDNNPLGTVEF